MRDSQRASYVPPANYPGGIRATHFFNFLNGIAVWAFVLGLELSLAYIAYCMIGGWGLEGSIHHFADVLSQAVQKW